MTKFNSIVSAKEKKSGFIPPHFFPKTKSGAGFTLIELLVVMAIIGLLASIALVSVNSVRANARDAIRIADMRTIQTALQLFHNKNGHHPGMTDGLLNNVGAVFGGTNPEDIALGVVLAPYLSEVPKDPLNDGGILYYYSYDPQHLTDDPPGGVCNGLGPPGAVLAFNKAETGSIILQKDTCSGGDMNQNNADWNMTFFPPGPNP